MSAADEGGRTHRVFAGIGRAAVRRPWWMIVGWLLATVAVAGLVAGFGRPVDDDTRLPGSDGQRGRDLIQQHFPGGDGASGTVVLRSADGRLDGASYRKAVDLTVRGIADLDHVVSVAAPGADRGSLSGDGRTGYLAVQFDVGPRDVGDGLIDAVLAATRPAADAGLEVLPAGVLAPAETSTRSSEAIGLGVALVVLVIAFGGLVAAGLPLVAALITLVCGIGAIGLAGHLTAVPGVATTIATMIGLGVGIDYALFLITRYRGLVERGAEREPAIVATVASSGSAVAFAGGTVIVALAGLAVSGVPILGTLGWTAGLIVLVAVGAAVTLVPASLAVLGPRIDALPVRRRTSARGSGWGRLAGRVTRRPWWYASGAALVLVVLALPATRLTLGQTDPGDWPAGSPARTGYEVLGSTFGPGINGSLTVLAELGAGADVAGLEAAVRAVPGVAATQPARISPDGRLAMIRVTPDSAPRDPRTVATADALRAVHGAGLTVHVTGQVAVRAELADRIAQRMPAVIGLVVLLAAVLVFLAFRAPVVAVKAAVMNLFSVAAAYGVLTAVFQWGWGATLLGLDGPVPIESYVPMLLFALLFGLSMDYEVFLLTAVRESWLATGDNARSVRDGLSGTGVVITSAALIMVCVFAGFVLSPSPVVKMMGVGLAVAVAIDATVIRGLLVPATMVLLGRANWWTPGSGRRRPGSTADPQEVTGRQQVSWR
ncbi:RND superfamily putative drug exporter [Actinoplanes octamycinicus]|uniref:RND superfamily putative drug exporter n=1 Tax=Actinoplanes octamycinicus TaxID=135948 RepID=A0A7W7M834_9ACTN|nr:MMPL family transporter [Actinoplanes octamycinicus]MBB4740479.1 RND superfamily putative drug exporter [Actinoplanes octamycinicus]GIE59739.1 membrane protein [Actinoplanes octamycinicus]